MKKHAKDTNRKCADILRYIVNRVNELDASTAGRKNPDEHNPIRFMVAFASDWGGNSLTVFDGDRGHSHIGSITEEYDTFENLVDQLYDLFIKGRGLSFEMPPTTDSKQ